MIYLPGKDAWKFVVGDAWKLRQTQQSSGPIISTFF